MGKGWGRGQGRKSQGRLSSPGGLRESEHRYGGCCAVQTVGRKARKRERAGRGKGILRCFIDIMNEICFNILKKNKYLNCFFSVF